MRREIRETSDVLKRAWRRHLPLLRIVTLIILELSVAFTDAHVPPTIPVAYLYHVPIVLGAHWFGYAGALTCALGSSALFHITTTVERAPYGEADIARLLTFLLVGVMVAEITRRRRKTETLNRQLQELQTMKEMLTRHLVHDLRTPLINVIVSLRILKRKGIGMEDDNIRNLIEIAIRGGEWLEGRIDDLLTLQQIQEGALCIRPESVPGEHLVSEAVAFVQQLALQKEIDVQVRVSSDLPLVWCERALMVRVLVNLLGNALYFTPRGGAVTVDVGRDTGAGAGVLFSVSDTGPGVPPEFADRVFDEFVQVESRQQGVRSGKGIGLTFCKRAVEAHGGRIWVESNLRAGSRFCFTIPTAPSEALSGSPSESLAPPVLVTK